MNIKVHFFSKLQIDDGKQSLSQDQMHSEKMTKLLAFLLINRNKICSVQDIAYALWDNNDDVNAAGAAKNLAWRLRKALRKIWPEDDFILTENGGYRWNPEVEVVLDVDEMRRYIAEAQELDGPAAKIKVMEKAYNLYTGKVLQDYESEHWIMPLTVFYQNLFVTLVKDLSACLFEVKDYETMRQVLTRAISEEPLDESLRSLMIQGLIAQEKYGEAEKMYHETTTMLYNTLGIGPSKELRNVYEETMRQRHEEENDLSKVLRDLKEAERTSGAFYCEYGVFKKIYELEARRQSRMGMTIYIALLTITPQDEMLKPTADIYKSTLEKGMMQMHESILSSLRAGDVVTRYSATQFLIMLPGCPYEMAEKVMGRIFQKFNKMKRKAKISGRYTLKEMQLENKELIDMRPYVLQPASVRICVNNFDENMTMEGYICGVSLPMKLHFESTEELLRLLSTTLDNIGRPQSATVMRRFGNESDLATPMYQIAPEMYFTSEEIRSHEGLMTTFDIQFLARQHSTWQGVVYGADGERVCEFVSELELIGSLIRELKKSIE